MVESIARFRAEYHLGRIEEIESESDCWGGADRGPGSLVHGFTGVHGGFTGVQRVHGGFWSRMADI